MSLRKLDSLLQSGSYQQIINEISKIRITKGEEQFILANAFENLNQEDSAFFYYQMALGDFKARQMAREVAKTNFAISSLLESQNNLKSNNSYFNDFWTYANNVNDSEMLADGYYYLARKDLETADPKSILGNFKMAFELYDSIGETKLAMGSIANIGAVYSTRIGNIDSARYYYFKALSVLKKNKELEDYSDLQFDLLNNIGNSFRKSKNYIEALKHYQIAETLSIKKYHDKKKKILYSNMDLNYFLMGDFENAYTYLYKYDSIKDKIGLASQNAVISDIQEKYDNEKLRADNLESEAKRIQNRNLLLVALALLFIGALVAILIYKNTSKKRRLAEQESIIKQQKLENVLKEQELVSIDAMIAGQEKERQKVANELHDDLGSLMATIKLHLDNANLNNESIALKSGQKLLEEAYQKIRGIAHTKNSGVLSKEGLLPALKKLAKTISSADGINVNVEFFGPENRLENSLELSIFRIIQELLTNILKHAEANNVLIQLTQHEDSINLIVEDNGKGFEKTKISSSDNGMGLTTIEKRIEHLEGTFDIDSVTGKGTSILIDIPF